jgi:hypothetical protein
MIFKKFWKLFLGIWKSIFSNGCLKRAAFENQFLEAVLGKNYSNIKGKMKDKVESISWLYYTCQRGYL